MLHPRVINDLCRYPMWMVDGINFGSSPGTILINGWR